MRAIKNSEDDFLAQAKDQVITEKTTRSYKSTNVGLNKQEWELLEKACSETGQTKKGFLRIAMIAEAKKVLKES